MAFIAITRDEIVRYMHNKAFLETRSGNEVVFERDSKMDPRLKIRVFTSLQVGEDRVRDCGSDAIRVVLVFKRDESFTQGVFSARPVARAGKCVEDIFGRVHDRILECANLASRMGPCEKCGGRCFADSKNCINRMCRMTKSA
jgi:hypothetical protein